MFPLGSRIAEERIFSRPALQAASLALGPNYKSKGKPRAQVSFPRLFEVMEVGECCLMWARGGEGDEHTHTCTETHEHTQSHKILSIYIHSVRTHFSDVWLGCVHWHDFSRWSSPPVILMPHSDHTAAPYGHMWKQGFMSMSAGNNSCNDHLCSRGNMELARTFAQ